LKTKVEQRAWEALPSRLAPKLLAALRKKTQTPGLDFAVPPAPLGGGYWALLYTFRLAQAPPELSGELVLRVMPASDEEARREATAQAAVLAAGFPAARVHLCGGRHDGLGFPFIVMARVEGGTLRAGLSWREKLSLSRLPVLLADTLAHLHTVDAKPFEEALAKVGWPPQSVGLEASLAALAERAAPLGSDGFAAGVAWLNARRPAPGPRVVCHGDFHPLNLMIADGRVSGLLDWSHVLLADPEYDIAYCAQLLAWWPLAVPSRGLLKHALGRPAAWQFIRAYRHRRPIDAGRYRWYEALHALRLLIRVARARTGITLPPLSPRHPWERVQRDAADAFAKLTGLRVALPRRERQ
jgi:aminoglycoside phosphotransferase (APT) family kinase protein